MAAKKKSAAKGKEKTKVTDEATAALGAPEQGKKPDIEKTTELIRYEYSKDELFNLSSKLVELFRDAGRIKAEKKSAVAGYDRDLKRIELEQNEVADNHRDGFEMKLMECYCIRDYFNRKVYFFRADLYNLEYLKAVTIEQAVDSEPGPSKSRDIKPWELQRKLEFNEKEKSDSGDSGDQPEAGKTEPTEAETV